MYNYTLFTVILLTKLLALYDVGDTISEEHQNKIFNDICFGDYPSDIFKLKDFQNKVIWLHFSATW